MRLGKLPGVDSCENEGEDETRGGEPLAVTDREDLSSVLIDLVKKIRNRGERNEF